MKVVRFIAGAVLFVGLLVGPVGPADALSGGCNAANIVQFDGTYQGNGLAGFTWTAGETVTVTASLPATGKTFQMGVNNVIVGSSDVPGTLTFTIPTSGVYPSVAWAVPLGQDATWSVSCAFVGFSINDVTLAEGDSGTTAFTFTISRTDTTGEASVDWATVDGSAVAPGDYAAVTATTLSFAGGEASKTVTVNVVGDTAMEANDGFTVVLTNPVGTPIIDGVGVGRITNDDSSSFSVNDATVTEGDGGTATATFTVTRTGATGGSATVNWFTQSGTATAGTDFVDVPTTTLTFAPFDTTKNVSVTVNGDTAVELNETFYVRLAMPTNATISDGSGLGRITNDDSATLSINDATVTEGNAGTKAAMFTITRSGDVGGPASVDWNTADGTATSASGDYVAVPATTVAFAAGQTSQTVSVTVNGDNAVETNETFLVKLTAPVNAGLGDPSGLGRITNDD